MRESPRLADARAKALTAGPWSVTSRRPEGSLTRAGKHDFFSEGPYWWPNPNDPKGPYIRRDGIVNPDRFTANDNDLHAMSEAVLALGFDAALRGDPASRDRAWLILKHWFVDPETRMNPNLEFGQAIRGVVDGRGIGIIDSRPLIWCVLGAALLETRGRQPEVSEPFALWISDYTDWLIHSKKGRDEQHNGNNHSTWWAAQVLAFALFTGRKDIAETVYAFFRGYLIPRQFRPDGSAPAEEARTKSLGYSIMNLDGFSLVCRMAALQGVDLWNYETQEGAGVLRAAEYIEPFLVTPEKWDKPQIAPIGRNRGYFLGVAGLDLGRKTWVQRQREFGAIHSAWGIVLEGLLAQAD